MRTSLLPLFLAASLASLAGCVVKEVDSGAAGAAGSGGSNAAGSSQAGSGGSDAGSAGAAGSNAGAGGSDAGAGGSDAGSGGSDAGSGGSGPADPCNGVPATGLCKDASTITACLIPDSQYEQPKVVEKKCPDGWTCQQDEDGARCQFPGECIDGDTRCKDKYSIEVCNGGKWAAALCPDNSLCLATGGKQATCGLGPEAQVGTTYPLKGNIQYEFRLPNDTRTGMAPPQTDGAFYMLIAAWRGQEFVGTAISDPEGNFEIPMTLPAGDDTIVYAFPMSFNYDGTQPLSAVARPVPNDEENDTSPAYWFFQYKGAVSEGATELGPWTVTEAEGSGAIWIFQWLEFGYRRMFEMYPDKPQMSVVTFWEPGVKFSCGACFHPPGLGSPRVDLGGGQYDHYDTRFSFTGTEGTPKHWQRSSIGHEFGHYVMSNYSISPNEGGPHGLSDESKPGLAYSEGWATFFGQRNMSEPDPAYLENVYFSVAGDTYWWYDLDKVATSSGIPKGNPDGALDQDISEAIVTSMMWNLWAPPVGDLPHKNLGDAPLFDAIVAPRTQNSALNRGYKRVDYVDYADGFTCSFPEHSSQVDEVSLLVGHPYKSAGKLCQ
jgi:hypothetical protein